MRALTILLAFAAALRLTAAVPQVVTANTILDDLVRQVGGDQVRTHCLVAPGADPHTFEPRPSDVKHLVAADLLVVNGLNLEPAILRLAQNSGFRGELVVATTGLTPRTGGCAHDHGEEAEDEAHNHATAQPPPPAHPATSDQANLLATRSSLPATHSAPDPHAWQSPLAVKTYVATIRDALARANPTSAELYRSRTAAYLAELVALDRWVREQVSTLPPARRRLVTSHDSLGYYADAYGFETVPVAGLSSSAEPDARALAAIVDEIRHEQVPAVFFELTTNPKLLRQIGTDAGVRLAEPLFTDSLGAPGSGAETYLDLIRTNTTRIVAALR